jgi:hypothetical protein
VPNFTLGIAYVQTRSACQLQSFPPRGFRPWMKIRLAARMPFASRPFARGDGLPEGMPAVPESLARIYRPHAPFTAQDKEGQHKIDRRVMAGRKE